MVGMVSENQEEGWSDNAIKFYCTICVFSVATSERAGELVARLLGGILGWFFIKSICEN